MKGVALFLLTVLVVAQLMVGPSEAITCSQVNTDLSPCATYLSSGTGTPSSQCCAGVSNLKTSMPTKADRQAACACLKQASSTYKNVKQDAATSLPQKCDVQVTIPIPSNADCSSVS